MKKLLIVVLALAMLFSLAACEKAETTTPDESTTEATEATEAPAEDAEPVEVSVTANQIGNDDASIELIWQPNPYHWLTNASDSKKEYLIPRVQEWANAHPDVKITVVDTTTTIQDAMAKTLIQTASGQAVDMAAIDSYVFPNFYQWAQPMTEAVAAAGIDTNDYFPYVQDVTIKDGEVMGIWYTTDVRFMFYRKDLIDTPPATWDELLAVCEDIKDDVTYPYVFQAKRDEGTMTNAILPMFYGQGAKLFDEAGNPVFGEGENREAMLNVVNFSKELIDKGYSPQRAVSSTLQDFFPDVAAGQVGMLNAANFTKGQMLQVISEEDFEAQWGIAQLPMPEAGQRSSIAGGWVSAILTEDAEKKVLCEDFLLWMYGSDDGNAGWCQAGGYLPTRASIYENYEYFSEGAFMEACVEELETAAVRPAAQLYPEASNELVVMFGDVLTGAQTAEAALDIAFENVKSAAE